MKQVALIDFCETVVNFQTFDALLNFIIMNEYPKRYRIINNKFLIFLYEFITKVLRKFGWNGYLYKNVLIRQLKGITIWQLQDYGQAFYNQKIKGNFIEPTLDFIKKLKGQDYHIVIVSGGSHFYIKKFAEDFEIHDIITAQLQFKQNKCTGVLERDCLGKNKVELVEEYFNKNNLNEIFDIAISDSLSDLPIFNLCRRKIVISKDKHQKWVTKDMEEIIWQ